MRRVILVTSALLTVIASAWFPSAAWASFGVKDLELVFSGPEGEVATQAGSHPFAMTASFGVNYTEEGEEVFTDGRLKDAIVELMAGLAGDTTAHPRCSTLDFLTHSPPPNQCSLDTAVGVVGNSVTEPGGWFGSSVFNLIPPPGVLLRLGFTVVGVDVVIDATLKKGSPTRPIGGVRNTPQALYVFASKLQLWGDPSDPGHNSLRGKCYFQNEVLEPNEGFEFHSTSGELCPVTPRSKPLLTLPTRCSGSNSVTFLVDSWEHPGGILANGESNVADPNWQIGTAEPRDEEGSPQPFTGCDKLGFKPSINARLTTKAAQSPTGMDFGLDVADEGLTSVDGLSQSQVKKVVVALPQGMSANPSMAEGLEVCTQADLAGETVGSPPGAGCPEASKIGTMEVESPLVSEAVKGALYQAEPYENEFGSLLAFYFVIKNPKLGIIVKQAAKVEADPLTGQLVAIADNIPQVPFSHFRLHLREGGRSPLTSPPSCDGDPSIPGNSPFTVEAVLTPWSDTSPVATTSTFKIVSGPDEAPCPPSGIAPFMPGFEAGTTNNAAGAYSPVKMHLTRRDGEQDMTRFSAILPPGLLGKIAGLDKCSNSSIAAARARTGPHGGREELEHPSCPASSRIGVTLAGAGVGSQLTYAPGSLYLAGPLGRAPLSIVAITPALAGPFDAGTVVVREALTVNPKTAEIEADGSFSDPIPHILKGIPLSVRDLVVYTDRPEFTLNPTNCRAFKTRATLFGSFLDVLNPVDDRPVSLEARYQAANCAALRFNPRLSLDLKGPPGRGGHPRLSVTYSPAAGDANIKDAVVRLPRSAFLDQAHIRTICTRVQFSVDSCPKGAQYGYIKAWTPLLDEPLQGPVYLRSSDHKLPDLVFDLHGLVDAEVVSRLDSFRGGIRGTIESAPDAPLSKVQLRMQGGQKGLIVNSRNLCVGKNRASIDLLGQNLKERHLRPLMRPSCSRSSKREKSGRRQA